MAKKQDAPTETKVNWAKVEPEWKAGITPIAELERRFKVSRAAIRKHFKKLGIERNVAADIQHAAATTVQRSIAAAGGEPPEGAELPDAGTEGASDAETVGVNARVQAQAILRHRRDLKRAQRVAGLLLVELEAQTDGVEVFARLDKLVKAAAKAGNANMQAVKEAQAAYLKAASYAGRLESLRRLSEAMKVLTELERRVLGIADDTPVDPAERVKQAVDSGMQKLRDRFKARGVKL